MNEPLPEKPPRRPRYRGKNPRHFAEKYKEHAPERYPEDVAKVLAAGKTPAGSHRSIMVREILECLALRPGEIVLDCTLGYGGHAREFLAAVQPGGRLIGLDVDAVELPKTEARLRGLNFPAESLTVVRSNFAGISKVLAQHAPGGVDGILADLGVSSMQIDNPDRGFTFKADGPLDMRMNPTRGITAAMFLQKCDAATLARCLEENADEPHAEYLARMLTEAQASRPHQTTGALAESVRAIYAKISRGEPDQTESAVRRVFQAIRIAINDEFGALDALLRQLPSALRPGGRVAILSFHSGEDRRVKQHFREGLRNGTYAHISDEVIQAGPDERRDNPRSASAKLRYGVRSR